MFEISTSDWSYGKWDNHFLMEEMWLLNALFRQQQEPSKLIDIASEKKLIDYASKHGLAQMLYRSKVVNSLEKESVTLLKKEYLSGHARNVLMHLILEEIQDLLIKNDIQFIVLKGSFLSKHIYNDPALRPYSDIDILVPENLAVKAWQLFAGDRNLSAEKNDITGHHLPPVHYRGAMVEVHRDLFAQNVAYRLPIDEIWQKSYSFNADKHLTLHPVHQLLYLCLHIYYNTRMGGIRLGWMMDIKKLIEFYSDQLNIEEVKKNAHRFAVYKPVALVLAFYKILDPSSNFNLYLKRNQLSQLEQIISFTRGAGVQQLQYSYSIAWERFWCSKGLRQKYLFVKQLIRNDNADLKTNVFHRVIYLIRNTFKMLFQLIKNVIKN